MALAGVLWLVLLAGIAVVMTYRRIDLARIRAALLPGVSVIAATALMTWAGHAMAGPRGVAVGVMLLLFAIFAVFAHLHAIEWRRAAGAGDHLLEPGRPV
jgi:hypothetical protein